MLSLPPNNNEFILIGMWDVGYLALKKVGCGLLHPKKCEMWDMTP